MPTSHPRPWRRDSLFGPGPRRPLDREERARFRYLLRSHARGGRLSPKGQWVGEALLKRLGESGQCDPCHVTIAADAGCSDRTVRRACAALRVLGLLRWQQRIVRAGWRAAQTSNQYVLVPVATPIATPAARFSCGGQAGRQTLKEEIPSMPPVAPEVVAAAQAALARRRAVIEARLLNKMVVARAVR